MVPLAGPYPIVYTRRVTIAILRSLPFMGIASQKHFIAVYHMGIYSDPQLLKWFTGQYPEHCRRKLDMGKSCIRFKYMDDIPYKLIGELASKMTTKEWISMYEKVLKK